jgi:spore germination protein GerM
MKRIIFAVAAALLLGIGTYLFFVSGQDPAEPTQEQVTAENTPGVRTVNLFYYDPSLDQDSEGNILCTERGLVPVSREIASKTPIQATIELLLSGNLTAEERASGITTEYPLPGVSLSSVALTEEGVLRIALTDPEHRTGGGSCRVAVLWSQIRATALQFPEVKEVTFQPEDLFQP